MPSAWLHAERCHARAINDLFAMTLHDLEVSHTGSKRKSEMASTENKSRIDECLERPYNPNYGQPLVAGPCGLDPSDFATTAAAAVLPQARMRRQGNNECMAQEEVAILDGVIQVAASAVG